MLKRYLAAGLIAGAACLYGQGAWPSGGLGEALPVASLSSHELALFPGFSH